jgi:hypothetical protein
MSKEKELEQIILEMLKKTIDDTVACLDKLMADKKISVPEKTDVLDKFELLVKKWIGISKNKLRNGK